MSNILYDITSDEPLPPGDGPRLHPLKDRYKGIKILELLSDSNDASSNAETGEASSGAHVFKVQIEQTQYALKVFKFQSVSDLRRDNFPTWNHRVDDATLMFHSDPFFAECRAYGRIEENYQRVEFKGSMRANSVPKKAATRQARSKSRRASIAVKKRPQNTRDDSLRQIAVPCHGFVDILEEPFEQIVWRKFGIARWNRPDNSRLPLRGLIKTLVEHEPAIFNPGKMLKDLKTLRRIGVYPMDIAERNYLGGTLVDFGLAWTTPYWADKALGVYGGDLAERYKHDDLVEFDEMLARSDVRISWRVRAAENTNMTDRLRPRGES